MKHIALLLMFCSSICSAAQTTSVSIFDSDGNSATATILNGNLYYHDANGNTATGTIKDGNVFLSTSKGEITLGTIRDGNVFLTNGSGGVTTGTIRNGNIFLSSSDGSVTTGSYGNGVYSTTTSTPQNAASKQKQEPVQKQREIQKENYDAGYAAGQAIGSIIGGALVNHYINSYCKANPKSTYLTSDGVAIPCPQAPLDNHDQEVINAYCRDNPGSWIGIGKHRVDCLTPPDPPNLKWAKWEMNVLQKDFAAYAKRNSAAAINEVRTYNPWNTWQQTYCSLAPAGATYKDLDGRKQTCH